MRSHGRSTRASVCLALLWACACQPARDPRELVVIVDAPVQDLDPRFAVDSPSAKLSRLVFAGLTQVDEHGLPQLDLAQSLTPVDEAGLHWQALVRSDARFHNGKPVLAADVAYTYSSVMDPALGAPIAAEFARRFVSVTADPANPRLVHFALQRPLATIWTDLVLGIVPARLKNQPKQRFDGALIGAGQWIAQGEARGVRVSVRRWLQHPQVAADLVDRPDVLTFRALGDEGARALSVLGGGGDVALGSLSPAVLRAAAEGGRAEVVTTPGIAWSYMALNLRQPPLHDVRVRRALLLGLDRAAIVRSLLSDLAVPADGMFAPQHWAHVSGADPAYDPALAQKLLDEAGLKPAPTTGVRLTLELKVSTSRLRRAVAQAIAQSLQQIGVEIVVRPFELATFLADVRAGRFQAFVLQLPEPVEPDQLGWMFHSQNAAIKTSDAKSPSPFARIGRTGLPHVFDPALQMQPNCLTWQANTWRQWWSGIGEAWGSGNRSGYADARVDCWLDRGRRAATREERLPLYTAVQQQLAQDLPVIPLWWESQTALVRRGVSLPHLAPDGRYAVLGDVRLHE